ncbi:MAG: MBL fold metallo-hydrolase [Clostridiales bacterium]|nr:MBL fold metallo-hydrolase [Clostridiales bacterium]
MKKRWIALLLTLVVAGTCLYGCGSTSDDTESQSAESADADGADAEAASSKPATAITAAKNAEWFDLLDFSDESEKENALRGLIEAPESVELYDDDGNVVWSVDSYDFISETADSDDTDSTGTDTADTSDIPDTVNPSLWRNTEYNTYAGLFEVCEGIYQVRGYDMSNITFIRTDNGWIVFDVLMCQEDSEAAMALMEKYFGELNIVAVLYSHSHIDHYGGIEGVIDKDDVADSSLTLEEQLASGDVVVLAPEGFLEEAISENVYVGVAMKRRAMYQYGSLLENDIQGSLGIGIGLGQSTGTSSLVAPTYEISENETIVIDGLEIQFQLTPGTEAPAEMNAYFPEYNALWLAENCTGTMHNLYTLRGAQVRDANSWAKYIIEAEQMFGDETEVVFQSHNWPHWGTETIKQYMEDTAAVYKFIHDETLRYINLGYTSTEIANMIELPERLQTVWYCRQYYGTLSHNVKAVYQKYMGWYDANPVNLNLLTPEETAQKWVEYLGDVDKVLEMAQADYDEGEYQWVAQVTMQLIYADPENWDARYLCADALEQLGYQAESGTWRNAYLTGAYELRNGNNLNLTTSSSLSNMISEMTMDLLLDYIGIRTDSGEAQDDDVTINFILTDTGETYYVSRWAGVVMAYPDETRDDADATITCELSQLIAAMTGDTEALAAITIEGDSTALTRFLQYCTTFTADFNIVEP